MSNLTLSASAPLKGEISVPGDKSISHRSVMLGSLARGTTRIEGFLPGADCLSTIACFKQMGVEIERDGDKVIVKGRGLHGLTAPGTVLDCGNSGTTTRLLSGIMAGQTFESTLTGDASIQGRPMKRIITPLSLMGARISGCDRDDKNAPGDFAPLHISPAPLNGISYDSPVASAQVKSAILLAGLYAEGETTVTEPTLSRNHTEIMLKSLGCRISSDHIKRRVTLTPGRELEARDITVPGDISSAAYFLVAALTVPGSEVMIRNVGVNETRSGILKALLEMGADITLYNENTEGEPSADIFVRYSPLKGTLIGGDIIPSLIDELPVLAVAAAAASGTTVIKDAAELRVKESDRIKTVTENLLAMGADVTPTGDGMVINGGKPLKGAGIKTYGDHRIAMSFSVAALTASGETVIDDPQCACISYPGFYDDLRRLADG